MMIQAVDTTKQLTARMGAPTDRLQVVNIAGAVICITGQDAKPQISTEPLHHSLLNRGTHLDQCLFRSDGGPGFEFPLRSRTNGHTDTSTYAPGLPDPDDAIRRAIRIFQQ